MRGDAGMVESGCARKVHKSTLLRIPDRSSLIPVSSRQAFFFSRPRDTPTTFTGYLNVTKYFEIIDTELSAYEKYWILDEWNYHDALRTIWLKF